MSYKQIRVCDGCGKEIKQRDAYKISKIDLQTGSFLDAAGSRDHNSIRQEFCDICAKKLAKTLEKIIQESELLLKPQKEGADE